MVTRRHHNLFRRRGAKATYILPSAGYQRSAERQGYILPSARHRHYMLYINSRIQGSVRETERMPCISPGTQGKGPISGVVFFVCLVENGFLSDSRVPKCQKYVGFNPDMPNKAPGRPQKRTKALSGIYTHGSWKATKNGMFSAMCNVKLQFPIPPAGSHLKPRLPHSPRP